MRQYYRRQQDARQNERAFGAAQQHKQRDRNDNGRSKLLRSGAAGKNAKIVQGYRPIGHNAHGARDHQPAGCAEETADHRIRHEADRAAGMREAEDAEQDSGKTGGKCHRDQGRRERVCRAGREPLQKRRHQRRDHDGDRAVRPGYGEGEGAAQRHGDPADGGG
jgi:hypothetical protein